MWIQRQGIALFLLVGAISCRRGAGGEAMEKNPKAVTEDEWRRRLTAEQYAVCREKGTEPSGSGEYLHHRADGTYLCVACSNPLFSSKTKYDACGWPSFWDALPDAVRKEPGLEAVCARCGSHLGHIFDDGPPPTGKRY